MSKLIVSNQITVNGAFESPSPGEWLVLDEDTVSLARAAHVYSSRPGPVTGYRIGGTIRPHGSGRHAERPRHLPCHDRKACPADLLRHLEPRRILRADVPLRRLLGVPVRHEARGGYDYYLGFYNRRENRLFCSFRAAGSTLLRHRRARYDPQRGVFCRIPTPWLDIRNEVGFIVRAWLQGQQVDRAPDLGRYVGL